MKRGGRQRIRRYNRRGAVVVEFALVLPVLMVLVFGIIEFGHIFFVRQGLINAARVGARTATLSLSDDEREPLVISRVQHALAAGNLDKYNIAIEYVVEPPPSSAHVVTVTVPYAEVSLLGPLLGFTDFDLTSSCAMFRDVFNN